MVGLIVTLPSRPTQSSQNRTWLWRRDGSPANIGEGACEEQGRNNPIYTTPTADWRAIGYVGYDCVKYFEPKTKRDDMKGALKVPESFFMLFDTMITFDHFFQVVKVITYLRVPKNLEDLGKAYEEAKTDLQRMVNILKSKEIPMPEQRPIQLNQKYTSNIG